MEKEKYIVWVSSKNYKKCSHNQFHTKAKSIQEAIDNCNSHANFEFKIMGVGGYKKVNVSEENFVNNKFY
jgi:hypothetical protein